MGGEVSGIGQRQAPMRPAARNIALFIDGTWNREGAAHTTNVRKLFEATETSNASQVAHYLRGVGTSPRHASPHAGDNRKRGDPVTPALDLERRLPPSLGVMHRVAGGAFGRGTKARIQAAYAALCQDFDRGHDRIFLLGFSRGAFAARSLAGFVDKVGLLLRDKLEHVDEAYRLYEQGLDASQSALADFLYRLSGRSFPGPEEASFVPIHLLGVWDTVAALGLPGRLSWFTAPYTEYHQVDVPPNVMVARHALALHELRPSFKPLLWKCAGQHQSLQQVWFPGAHADVGGGYANDEAGMSDAALRWMADEAESQGLRLKPDCGWRRLPYADPVLHHEIKGVFAFGYPQVRQQLERAWRQDPEAEGGFRFHCTARDRVLRGAGRSPGFAHPLVNAALRRADECSLARLIDSRRLGVEVVGDEGSAARPASSGGAARSEGRWLSGAGNGGGDPWAAVTLADWDASSTVILDFLGGAGGASDDETAAFARALALRTLLEDDCMLRQACRLLRAGCSESETRSECDAAREPGARLQRYESVLDGMERCAALLPPAMRPWVDGAIAEASATVSAVRNRAISEPFSKGVGRPVAALATARFRRPLKPPGRR